MKTSFDKIMNFILEREGGAKITENPKDPGGLTKYGISQRAHPDVDIRNLTEDKARAIYRADYWDKLHGDALPYPLDMCSMDTAVNCGLSRSLDMLKRSGDYRDFLLDRVDYYATICEKNANLRDFFRGWINRVSLLRKLCRG